MSEAATDGAARGVIRDQGYQKYTGAFHPEGSRWGLIASRMLRMTARQGGVTAMLIVAIFPALLWAVGPAWPRFMGVPIPIPADNVFEVCIKPYGMLLIGFLTAMFAGAGAIADDVRGGASQFYFARPVGKVDYMIGKLLPPLILVTIVIVAPALLVSLVRVALGSNGEDVVTGLLVVLKGVLFGSLEAAVLTLPVVALSSLARSRGFVQGGYAAAFALPWIVGAIFVSVTRSPWPDMLSLPAHLRAVGVPLFGIKTDALTHLMPWWVSAAFLTSLIVGSLAVIRRQLGRMEVMGS